jgi:hypothetical protein
MSGDVSRLELLAALAEEAGADTVARDARALAERVREGRFFVACLGQFKRGKSTVINALVGEPVLPSGVAPVTSVITVVRHGERRARVRIGQDDWRDVPPSELHLWVAESENPENQKNVTGVEVFCPSPLLARGLCLVDTPGIGSVFAGNTAETRAFVPHVDAALVVLGGDPPISGEELELVGAVAKDVPAPIFALNKADRLSASELSEARAFTESVLERRLGARPRLFAISAIERLEERGDPREWPLLVEALESLERAARGELVAKAASRGEAQLVERLRRQLAQERAALLRPVEESERRLEELRRCAARAEQSLVELSYLFNAEQDRLSRRFSKDADRFVAYALPRVKAALEERLRSATARGPALRRFAIDQAQELAEALVRTFRSEEEPVAEREFAQVTERFVAHANGFLRELVRSGALEEDTVPAVVVETGLRARSGYFFAPFMALTTPPVWQWVADWLRPERALRESVLRGAGAFAKRLLEANAGRVVGDFVGRIIESRRGVEAALRRTLAEIVATAERAARRASEVRRRGADAVAEEVATIDARLARLDHAQAAA